MRKSMRTIDHSTKDHSETELFLPFFNNVKPCLSTHPSSERLIFGK